MSYYLLTAELLVIFLFPFVIGYKIGYYYGHKKQKAHMIKINGKYNRLNDKKQR